VSPSRIGQCVIGRQASGYEKYDLTSHHSVSTVYSVAILCVCVCVCVCLYRVDIDHVTRSGARLSRRIQSHRLTARSYRVRRKSRSTLMPPHLCDLFEQQRQSAQATYVPVKFFMSLLLKSPRSVLKCVESMTLLTLWRRV